MNRPLVHDALGFRVIGAFKVLSGLLFLCVGLGIYRMLDRDLAEWLLHVVSLLRLDPGNRFIHWVIAKVSGLRPHQLRMLGVGTLVYAALHLVEGTGLLLRRKWAGYLTVIATGSLIPVEGFEVLRRVNPTRIAVMVANVAIVVYLLAKLRQEHQRERSRAGMGTSTPGEG